MDSSTGRAHGVGGYTSGCRCDTCRVAWSGYQKKRARKAGRRSRAQYIAALKRGDMPKPTRVEFPGKTRNVTVALTPLGAKILEAAQAREDKSFGDVMERLLREYAERQAEQVQQ